MAQGQTTRNNLSLRNTEDVQGAFREIKRWGDRLPLGSAGFHVYSTVNQGPLATGSNTSLNFNTTLTISGYSQDKERWKPSGTVNSFTVPPGLSGVYVMAAAEYHSNVVANMFLSINVNGVAVSAAQYGPVAVDVAVANTVYPLHEQDVLTVNLLNASGANQTVTAGGGVVNVPLRPFFSAWRISLL